MNRNKMTALILMVALLTPAAVFGADPGEPGRPDTGRVFDEGKEKKVREIAGLSPQEFFLLMKTDEFLADPDLMHKAIYTAFGSRRQDILTLARQCLTLPQAEYDAGRPVSRARDFDVARRILETFPQDAAEVLSELYEGGDEIARGNSVQAAGSVAGGQKIKRLLIKALDDTAFYEASGPEDMGEPLRVCDAAYNQLVLRYRVKDVHRTISPALAIEVRDQLVNMLRGKFLKEGKKT